MANNSIIELRNWTMYVIKNKLVLSGLADEHPKLGRNVELAKTSAVLSIEEDKSFIMTCRTLNSVYRLNWAYANLTPREFLSEPSTLECAETVRDKYITYLQLVKSKNKKIDELNAFLQSYMKVIAEGRKNLENYIDELDSQLVYNARKYNNCIYMSISSISKGNNIAYNIKGETGIINPSDNEGYYVSTVEYKKLEKSGLNIHLGYFIGDGCIDIYNISEDIENVVIHNNKKQELIVNGKYHIRFDETVVIESNKIRG